MEADPIYFITPSTLEPGSQAGQLQPRHELLREFKRRTNTKIRDSLRQKRSAFCPPRWPSDNYTLDSRPPTAAEIGEPAPAMPDPRLLGETDFCDRLTRFKEWVKASHRRAAEEETAKAMDTEATTAVGDNDDLQKTDALWARIDEEEVEICVFEFNFKAAEEDRLRREKQARLRQLQNPDSHLLAQLSDSCPLQGEVGLAACLGQFFPALVDVGFGQAQHKFWASKSLCPELREYWAAAEPRADKLFVPVDRSNETFIAVIGLWKELDERAAEMKRAVAAYYCCFALFYGQKPRQSAHVEHRSLKHDLDKRIVSKTGYDHAEDSTYDKSVNTAKLVLGFVKEQAGERDEVDAYLQAWKRLAGKGRWWFTDSYTGQEWIAVPWLWTTTEPSEKAYLKNFDRCWANDLSGVHLLAPKPELKADPEAEFDVRAGVLARKAACLRSANMSFKEVAAVIWLVQFREPLDQAHRKHELNLQKLGQLSVEGRNIFEMDMEFNEDELLLAIREFEKNMRLVFTATSIVFERAPSLRRNDAFELEISWAKPKCRQQVWRDTKQTDSQRKNAAEKKAAAEKLRREEIRQDPALQMAAREKERLRKAIQREKKRRGRPR